MPMTAPSETMNKLHPWLLSSPHLLVGSHALEREGLRVAPDGRLAQTPHSTAFGHPLTHPLISTDFSESQLELITEQFDAPEGVIDQLAEIHRFLYHNLGEEMLWPFSAPCRLPSDEMKIPLAQYGDSEIAQQKVLYRSGLGYRYGRRMQTLSGVHYNFSLDPEFFAALAKSHDEVEDIQSEVYLHITRNFLRWAWLPILLFGATPAFDKSFLPEGHPQLEELDPETWYMPYATSLRLSEIGYTSSHQARMAMSYDSLSAFVTDLKRAVSTPTERYRQIGTNPDGSPRQINNHVLQIEAEHYEAIRPKPRALPGKRPLEALATTGIAYLEVRCIDLDPMSLNAISADQLRFLHLMMLSCLAEKSSSIGAEERWNNFCNQNRVAIEGRKPGLVLQTVEGERPLEKLATERLKAISPIAEALDRTEKGTPYSDVLQKQQAKLQDATLLPSHRLLKRFQNEGYINTGLQIAKRCRDEHLAEPYPPKLAEKYRIAAERSIREAL